MTLFSVKSRSTYNTLPIFAAIFFPQRKVRVFPSATSFCFVLAGRGVGAGVGIGNSVKRDVKRQMMYFTAVSPGFYNAFYLNCMGSLLF